MNSLGLNKSNKDTKVVVAMSGGVDSSVAAAMLKKEGYDVLGITLKLYAQSGTNNSKSCCSGQDIDDAKKVAQKYDFPHQTYDYQSRFFTGVIDNFIESYSIGETPIPCIKCNQTVKFTDLLNSAIKNKADVLVTGHYVRRIVKDNIIKLYKALDENKDQSYFLFATLKDQLEYLRFPLGGYLKSEIRDMADSLQLPVKNKPDSQDICFVTTSSYRQLIDNLKPDLNIKGNFLDMSGNKIGTHDGIANYTVGQRKGLGISGLKNPVYVIKIDALKNNIYLGEENYLKKTKIYLKDINWLDSSIDRTNLNCLAKIRSNQREEKGTLIFDKDTACFTFEKETNSTSPGQACVFYLDNQVLGGGWITKTSD